jgi:O-acetyl-ADP-ribose deacetylase (regulator of RNase III)
MTDISVVGGDITQVPADALVTAINSGGMWFGGIDRAIQRSSGGMFHAQAQAEMPLKDGHIVYAPARGSHDGKFESVLFIIDDLSTPLYDLVGRALDAVNEHQLRRISIPAIRTGVMAGVVESHGEALNALAEAILDFVVANPQSLSEINIVVYDNQADVDYLLSVFSASKL